MYEIFEKLLNEKGISVYKVSKETGITTATLTSWKQGKYTPKQDKLQKIADFFGVSLDYLLGRTEQKTHVEIPDENISSEIKKVIQEGKIFADKNMTDEQTNKCMSLALNSVTAYDLIMSLYSDCPEIFIDKEYIKTEGFKSLKLVSAKDFLLHPAARNHGLFRNMNFEIILKNNTTNQLSTSEAKTTLTDPRVQPIIDSLDRAGDLESEDIDEIAQQVKFLIDLKRKKK